MLNNFLKEIKEKVLVFDGSKGYMLQRAGMKGGECPELWNATHSDEVKKIYSSYKASGSNVIQTNTFQGNRIKLEEYGLGERTYELNFEAARLAKEVMGSDGYVAASIGPIGQLFEPSGDLTFDCAYETFKEQVQAVVDGGADIVNFETFTDLAEMRAALLAAKAVSDLPVICSISFEANGKTLMGTDPYTAAVVLKSMGADMIGTNCSLGPEHLLNVIKKMYEAGGIYLCVKPNAGLPELINGEVIYKASAEKFAEISTEFVKYGVRLIGGCCGTTPEFIKAIKESIKGMEIAKLLNKPELVITSGVKLLNIDEIEKLNVGQLNTELDNELLDELSKGNFEYITDKALELACEGFDAIFIKADSAIANRDFSLLANVVNAAQAYLREPFIIESQHPEALKRALMLYKGKAGVVLNGYPAEVVSELLAIAKKYGSTVVDKSLLGK